LQSLFQKDEISPSRLNNQLVGMSRSEISKYRLFSGHLDWALLDCVESPKFVFTVLREPRERILSFYFFLRRQAALLSPADLELPQHEGMRAALRLPCDEYFCGGKTHLRLFLDNHYDNFYAYYFASRIFEGRSRILARRQVDTSFDDEKVVRVALDNLAHLDGLYTVDDLTSLETDIKDRAGLKGNGKTTPLQSIRVNVGDTESVGLRGEQLSALGATKQTFNRIDQMTRLDNRIWDAVLEKRKVA